MKRTIAATLIMILTEILFGTALMWWSTDPEVWCAGMHDLQCELMDGDQQCNCHERLIKSEKEKEGK